MQLKINLHTIIRFFIFMIFLSDFKDLTGMSGAFKILSLSTELASMCLVMICLLLICFTKKVHLTYSYTLLGTIFCFFFLGNVIINEVPAGAIIGGIRRYFLFVPFFMIPLIYPIEEEEIKKDLKLILYLAILQVPISILQRLVIHSELTSGDVVRGTMSSSGSLTIFLCCVVSILLSFYLHKKITMKRFLVLLIFIFIPIIINETKGALFLIPLTLFVPIYFSNYDKSFMKKTVILSSLMFLVVGGFITFYNYFWVQEEDRKIQYFWKNRASDYLYKDLKAGDQLKEPGRLDVMKWAYDDLSRDKVKLITGLGFGNVAHAEIGFFRGKLAKEYKNYNVDYTTISHLLMESGIVGILILYSFLILVLRDSLAVNKLGSGLDNIISSGWISIAIIILFSSVYKNLIIQNAIGVLYFYFSGYIVFRKNRLYSSE